MISPYADGGDLHTHMWKYRLNPRLCVLIGFGFLLGVARGMAYVHSRHVIHGDLKPANVLIVNGIAKVTDFGMSRIRMDMSAPTLTAPGAPQGTMVFMAPEILTMTAPRKKKSMDVYAFAMIAYEVFHGGWEPFYGVPIPDLITRVRGGGRPPRIRYVAGPIWRLMEKCWDQDPERRPTFDHIVEEMEGIEPRLEDWFGDGGEGQ